jgi:hypothetical protein
MRMKGRRSVEALYLRSNAKFDRNGIHLVMSFLQLYRRELGLYEGSGLIPIVLKEL